MPMEMQREILETTIDDWKKTAGVDQLDDIQVIGVRLNRNKV